MKSKIKREVAPLRTASQSALFICLNEAAKGIVFFGTVTALIVLLAAIGSGS